jgi:hypothetical protein
MIVSYSTPCTPRYNKQLSGPLALPSTGCERVLVSDADNIYLRPLQLIYPGVAGAAGGRDSTRGGRERGARGRINNSNDRRGLEEGEGDSDGGSGGGDPMVTGDGERDFLARGADSSGGSSSSSGGGIASGGGGVDSGGGGMTREGDRGAVARGEDGAAAAVAVERGEGDRDGGVAAAALGAARREDGSAAAAVDREEEEQEEQGPLDDVQIVYNTMSPLQVRKILFLAQK